MSCDGSTLMAVLDWMGVHWFLSILFMLGIFGVLRALCGPRVVEVRHDRRS